MFRRFSLVALLVASSLMMLRAQASVTFVLTNGDRATGDVASFSEASPTMPFGELNLEQANRDERSFGLEMVAVIDYAGGDAESAEIRALPARGQFLVLRNGTRTMGRLVDLRSGTLRWSGADGQQSSYPVGEIARIYLDVEAARAIFSARSGRATPDAPAARGGRAADGSFVVPANRAWTDTGITVRGGEVFRFSVTGEIKFGTEENQTANADGNAAVRSARYPVPALPVGGLIGRVGGGRPFPIGTNTGPITLGQGGRLSLGINDDAFTDNSGAFRVVITRGR